jgi:peptide/nickel transport system permease protein
VLIAGAVSCDPSLLIADEPTTALDVTVQAEVLDVIRRLGAERHLGVVMVTHDFGVVADICDRVAVMRSGRIVEQGDVDEIFSAPREGYTRMLLASTLEDAVPGVPLRLDEEFA